MVRKRLWRTSNPALSEAERQAQVHALMLARRDVRTALREPNPALLRDARARVQAAKLALGERGSVWWSDGAPDFNRHLIKNTPYAEWWASLPEAAADR